jgi:hypothetical protein
MRAHEPVARRRSLVCFLAGLPGPCTQAGLSGKHRPASVEMAQRLGSIAFGEVRFDKRGVSRFAQWLEPDRCKCGLDCLGMTTAQAEFVGQALECMKA